MVSLFDTDYAKKFVCVGLFLFFKMGFLCVAWLF